MDTSCIVTGLFIVLWQALAGLQLQVAEACVGSEGDGGVAARRREHFEAGRQRAGGTRAAPQGNVHTPAVLCRYADRFAHTHGGSSPRELLNVFQLTRILSPVSTNAAKVPLSN